MRVMNRRGYGAVVEHDEEAGFFIARSPNAAM
jgi:hypothetical protein